jgi:hypothetical protein
MQRSKLMAVLVLGTLLAIPMRATGSNPEVLGLQAVVNGSASYNIKPPKPIPAKPKETFTLTLTATEVDSSGKVTRGVPIDVVFDDAVDHGRLTLANPTANGVDVTVNEIGRHGNLLHYKVTATDVRIRAGLAEGYISVQ